MKKNKTVQIISEFKTLHMRSAHPIHLSNFFLKYVLTTEGLTIAGEGGVGILECTEKRWIIFVENPYHRLTWLKKRYVKKNRPRLCLHPPSWYCGPPLTMANIYSYKNITIQSVKQRRFFLNRVIFINVSKFKNGVLRELTNHSPSIMLRDCGSIKTIMKSLCGWVHLTLTSYYPRGRFNFQTNVTITGRKFHCRISVCPTYIILSMVCTNPGYKYGTQTFKLNYFWAI